jgi:hypothetical protein
MYVHLFGLVYEMVFASFCHGALGQQFIIFGIQTEMKILSLNSTE